MRRTRVTGGGTPRETFPSFACCAVAMGLITRGLRDRHCSSPTTRCEPCTELQRQETVRRRSERPSGAWLLAGEQQIAMLRPGFVPIRVLLAPEPALRPKGQSTDALRPCITFSSERRTKRRQWPPKIPWITEVLTRRIMLRAKRQTRPRQWTSLEPGYYCRQDRPASERGL